MPGFTAAQRNGKNNHEAQMRISLCRSGLSRPFAKDQWAVIKGDIVGTGKIH